MKIKHIVGLAAVTATVAVTLTGCSAGGPPKTPEEGLDSYFQALVDGKAERALEIIPAAVSDVDKKVASDALTDKVYGKATHKITDFTVGTPVADPDEPGTTETTVSYSLDGDRRTSDFKAHETKDGIAFEPHSWGTVDLSDKHVADAKINGVAVKAKEQHLLPGQYEVTAKSDTKLLTLAKLGKVTAGSSTVATFKPTKEAFDQVTSAIKAKVSECLAVTDAAQRPGACPNLYAPNHDSDTTYSDAKWTLVKDAAPELEYAFPENDENATGPVLRAYTVDGKQGQMDVTYKAHTAETLFTAAEVLDEEGTTSAMPDIDKITIDGDKLTVEFSSDEQAAENSDDWTAWGGDEPAQV